MLILKRALVLENFNFTVQNKFVEDPKTQLKLFADGSVI